MMSLENLNYPFYLYHCVSCVQIPSFSCSLFSRIQTEYGEEIKKMSWKIRPFLYVHLNIWPAPYYHELNFFSKSKAVLTMSLKILRSPIITSWKSMQRSNSFDDVTQNFELPLLSQGKLFQKIKQFYWYDLKFWTAPIIMSWNFLKNMADFMRSLENLQFPHYHELKFLEKIRQFWWCHLKI